MRPVKSVLVLASIALAGCYVYEPVRPADAMLDARVRATVSPEQSRELEPVLRNVTPSVSGRLVDVGSDAIMLEVPLYGSTPGVTRTAVHNRVEIPIDDLVSLESRHLSTWRTAAAAALVATAAGTAFFAVVGDESIEDKEKTGIDHAIVTLFSIPFAIFR